MEELNQQVHSLEFRIADKHLKDGKFDITELEAVLDTIYDKTEDIDEDLDIDITDRDMYIMSDKIEEVLPVIKEVMEDSGYFDMTSLILHNVDTK
jgi:ferritin-like metal-binding protein YciE